VFCAAVVILAVPLLTPCGSLSIPLKIVQIAGDVVAGGKKEPVLLADHNNVANTPPLRVIPHAGISRSALIGDAEALSAQRHQGLKPLRTVGNAVGDTFPFAAVIVDPTPGGGANDGMFPGFGDGVDIKGLGKPRNPRGSVVIMKSSQVELHGYKIYTWPDKGAPCGIGRARVDASAKVLVKESGGHEYFALVDNIHYHAQRHELILEGTLMLRCGGQTIRSDKPVLARLNVMTRTLEVSGACSITTSQDHDDPVHATSR
jgi:hypothetical protein